MSFEPRLPRILAGQGSLSQRVSTRVKADAYQRISIVAAFSKQVDHAE